MLSTLYGVLLPFFVSLLLAYLLDPFVNFVQHTCRVKYRAIAVAIVLICVVGIIILCLHLLIPPLVHEASTVFVAIERYITNLDLQLTYDDMRDAVVKVAPKVLEWLTGGLSWLTELVAVFFGILYLIFLMMAFPKIRANWSNYVPVKYRDKARVLVHDLNRNMNAYFRGQSLVAFIVGILFAIGFKLIGMPMGITMGLIVGVLNLVPYMQGLGIPPCILLCLVQSAQTGRPVWVTLSFLALVFIVVQSLQDMVLIPKIMGKEMGLSPATILLSLTIWGAFFGVIGMIVALPITTLIVSYYRNYIAKGEKQNIADHES